MGKKINVNKIFYTLIVIIIIFQDSFEKITSFKMINYFDEILILIYFIHSLYKSNFKIPKYVYKLWGKIILFATIGIAGSIIYSSYTKNILIISTLLSIKFALLVSAVVINPPNEKTKLELWNVLKVIGIVVLISGIINFIFAEQWAKLIPTAYVYKRMGFNSSMSFFIHAGQYGWYLLFIALIYLSEYRTNQNKKGYLYFIILSVGAILSLKVKVIVGFIAIIFVNELIIKEKINTRRIVASIIIILLTLILFGGLIFNTYKKYLTNNNDDYSARYALLSTSITIAKDKFPIGVGFGKFGSYYAKINYSEYYYNYNLNQINGLKPTDPRWATDTFWPSILGETGVIGFVVYLLLLLQMFRVLQKNIKKTNSKFVFLAFLVFIQALIESLGEPIFNSSPQNIIIAFIIGIAINEIINGKKEQEK